MGKETFDREYKKATEAAARANQIEPRAKSARYDRRSHRIVVELRNGASFIFPPDLAQGLAGASPEDLANVQVTPSGTGLRWPTLDADFSLPNLLNRVFGTPRWMAQIGQKASGEFKKKEPQRARNTRRTKRR
jgi:hypothetical protein